jgi:catechol 2,3-dioxygenase-like lactoylglutathione lyase family enzyme
VSVRSLWLPFEVADVGAARDFYTVHFGLSQVDEFDGGVVLRVPGPAHIELAAAGRDGGPPPLAFELDDAAAVDTHAARLGRTATRHPRGHYACTAPGPAGATVMVWSERE